MSQSTDDGRVTLALLGAKLDHIGNLLNTAVAEVDTVSARVEKMGGMLERLDERWAAHRGEHDRQNMVLSVIGAIESLVAAFVGMLLGRDRW